MKDIHQILKTRPTYVEIDFDALRHNYSQIKKYIGDTKLLCVVKGNGYGHGIVEVSREYEKLGADYLGVAIPEEGAELRQAGISTPILVMGGIAMNQLDICLKNNLTICVPSDEKMLYIDKLAKELGVQAKIHLKVDTGMGRIGVSYKRIQKYFDVVRECQNCDFEGIYSHFSCSDVDKEYTDLQISRFKEVLQKFKQEGFDLPIAHIANSAGLLNYPDAHFNMVRAGIILYGLHEGFNIPKEVKLQPVMSWYSQVVYFKFLEKGEPISYGKRYITEQDTRIVTAPVGYADGYQRKLSNTGSVLINGKRAPVVGLVCMDHIMIDIGPDGEAYKGDRVTLVGKDGDDEITFYDLSKWAGSSVHELIAQISYRVPRFYKN